jgi:hypothetical protein
LVREARIGTYLGSKGQPSGCFRKAVRLRPFINRFLAGKEQAVFEPFLLVFGALFFVTDPSSTTLLSPNAFLSHKSFIIFLAAFVDPICFPLRNRHCQTKTPTGASTPTLNPNSHPNLHPDPVLVGACWWLGWWVRTLNPNPTLTLVLHFNVDSSGDFCCQVVSFLSFL